MYNTIEEARDAGQIRANQERGFWIWQVGEREESKYLSYVWSSSGLRPDPTIFPYARIVEVWKWDEWSKYWHNAM